MSAFQKYGSQDLEILNEQVLYQGFFQLKKIEFKHRLFAGGWSQSVSRELLVKGSASAVIAYDPALDTVVLVEQVRIGAYQKGQNHSPWLLELIAGMVEDGEQPEEVAVRESQEEAGVTITELKQAVSIWDSPGGVFERIHIFVGKVDSNQAQGIHGLIEEHEDIQVHVVPRETAYQWVCEGKIDNSIAVIGLQWLQLNYQQLQQNWL